MQYGNYSQLDARQSCLRRLIFSTLAVGCFLFQAFVFSASAYARENDTHLYFITSEGCAPCRQVEPAIEALQREGYPVTTVHYGQHQEWAQKLGVDRTPTVVMITNDKMVGRHAGIIDAVTLKKWFAVQGIAVGKTFAAADGKQQSPGGTKVVLDVPASQPVDAVQDGQGSFRSVGGNNNGYKSGGEFSSLTMHKGTEAPKNRSEQIALNATVRLKVDDPTGTSYATGTVIHSYRGENLVVTCGHVFRDANGKGEITAEYGFSNGQQRSAPGELVFYDADARDIGLVVIRTGENIEPVRLAAREANIRKGLGIFSVGCDNGDDPTIRRSQIKNKAAYDGSIKYDIYGRPVSGRSGGGLFTKSGELIGICNAAAVEVDEGIYTALDTIYWQIAKVNLEHLFDANTRIAATPVGNRSSLASATTGIVVAPVRIRTVTPVSDSALDRPEAQTLPSNARLARIESKPTSPYSPASFGSQRTPVSWNRPGAGQSDSQDKEVVILVRSKSDPSQTETITIGDPTPKLLDYLESMSQSSSRVVDVAQLRRENESRH